MNNLLARWANRPTLQLLLIFVLLDAGALTCAWLFKAGTLHSLFFRLGEDRGLIELIEYGKFALIIYMLLELWRRTGEPVFKAWMILFVVMLADNALCIHEQVGELLATYIALPDVGLKRPKDLGEFLSFAMLEGSLCLYVAWAYLQSTSVGRSFSRQFFVVFGVFVFFALLLDTLHKPYKEELGEVGGMTLIMGWLHYRFRNKYSV